MNHEILQRLKLLNKSCLILDIFSLLTDNNITYYGIKIPFQHFFSAPKYKYKEERFFAHLEKEIAKLRNKRKFNNNFTLDIYTIKTKNSRAHFIISYVHLIERKGLQI